MAAKMCVARLLLMQLGFVEYPYVYMYATHKSGTPCHKFSEESKWGDERLH
jgi:hypothetical protein